MLLYDRERSLEQQQGVFVLALDSQQPREIFQRRRDGRVILRRTQVIQTLILSRGLVVSQYHLNHPSSISQRRSLNMVSYRPELLLVDRQRAL